MRKKLRNILVVLFLIFVVALCVSNRELITLKLLPLPWQFEMPVFLFGLIMLAVGYLWGSSIAITQRYRVGRTAKREHAKAEALTEEVAALRAERPTPSSPLMEAPKTVNLHHPAA